jgi:hypothetical protein
MLYAELLRTKRQASVCELGLGRATVSRRKRASLLTQMRWSTKQSELLTRVRFRAKTDILGAQNHAG